MVRHLGLIAVCACIVASVGCEGRDGIIPPTPTPTPTVKVEFGGRVVNADAGGPIGNVRVSLYAWGSRGGGLGSASAEEIPTSGGDGIFTIRLNLPSDWTLVYLEFTGPAGYDVRVGRFEPTAACRIAPCWAAADRPDIRMYPALVIRPGESIEVRVDSVIAECGFAGDGGPCRRVLVAAPPGGPVELEIVPDDSSQLMSLSLEAPFSEPDMSVRRLMVPPGGAPYVLGAGTARLTARRITAK